MREIEKLGGSKLRFKELETERLYLKNITIQDAEFLFEEFSDDEITQYLFDAEPMKNVEDATKMIHFYLLPEPRDHHRWVLVRKEDGAKLGTCGFHCWKEAKRQTEVGYDMKPEFWGHGYMKEALRAILVFAHEELGINIVDAHIYPDNVNSSSLVKKLGFELSEEEVAYEYRGEKYMHQIYRKNFDSSN